MVLRGLAKAKNFSLGPTAPMKSFSEIVNPDLKTRKSFTISNTIHQLTNKGENKKLYQYETNTKKSFDSIVSTLKEIAYIQHNQDFIKNAQQISQNNLGINLPEHILDKSWLKPLDIRALYAWCVFKQHEKFSDDFFKNDPLEGSAESNEAKNFEKFLLDCGFHLLDITPCSDGRLAHTVAYVMRIPFSAVRRRSHAGALFDIENTVNRWIKTEHKRYREGLPNLASKETRYLKIVTYHFSSVDPLHQGCAAHGSNDDLAAQEGLNKLLAFREAVENSFCCGASVDLMLIGLDTDTDALKIHLNSDEGEISLENTISTLDIYNETITKSKEVAEIEICKIISNYSSENELKGMGKFIYKLIKNNISQIDYVKQFHEGSYEDVGHAERFIGVGIGFKEVHLRNLTYFSHLDTVEEGAPDLDVGIKIFKGLNVSEDLPIPVVIRFDYSGRVPGAKERAIKDCDRVNNAITMRYKNLVDQGLLHTCLSIRDRDKTDSAQIISMSLDKKTKEAH
tara:strand:+ start:1457 stop:2986 length:1530 start_codon:yes stop_codon:yes gene_type:complete